MAGRAQCCPPPRCEAPERLRSRLGVWHSKAGCLTALRSGTRAACPARSLVSLPDLGELLQGESDPSLLGQGGVWGEGEQNWHKTT